MKTAVVLLALLAATGCAVDTGPPARTAERFLAAATTQQGEIACELLARRTAEKLPDKGQTCAQALVEVGLRGGAVKSVAVWGDEAQVRLDGDTLFLHRFGGGWRVKAAGCAPRGDDLPYECEVED
ncbi:hypothetical protein AB0B45_32950 [Nonomuraea sp. NPDC049152]|uniref:hypothetical protein n=1 Tax=Nonomuraea sp. NPDC049152 TaxID=3154350 RepID=UPI003400CF2D